MGLTYFGHPVACRAALKNIEIIENEALLPHARSVGERFQQQAQNLTAMRHVGDVRGHGLMLALDLVADKDSKTPFPASFGAGARVFEACLENGLVVRPVGDRIVLSPPIIINEAEIDQIVSTLGTALQALDR